MRFTRKSDAGGGGGPRVELLSRFIVSTCEFRQRSQMFFCNMSKFLYNFTYVEQLRSN